MGHVITGDKIWIHYSDPATKQESIYWKSPQSPVKKKVHPVKLMNKVMLILFFNVRGAVFQHIVQPYKTVDALYYREVLKTLKRNEQEEASSEKNGFCITITLSCTPLPSSENFCIIEKLKFSHTSCTVLTLPYVIFGGFGALKWELRNRHFESDVDLVTDVNGFFQDLPLQEFYKMMAAK